MALTCTPDSLADASECYKKIPPGDREAVMIYLLQQIASNTETTAELVAHSICYAEQIDKQLQPAVIVYLLCAIAAELGA